MSNGNLAVAEPFSPAGEQINAIAGMPAGLALLKMENDSIQALAAARPRDFNKIKNELLQQLQEFPVLAEEAIYNKPVGKDKQTGQQKYARNLSIRAAEAIAEVYGYNRIRVDVTDLDSDTVKVEATFTDYQRGRIWQDAGILSKFYKDFQGRMQRIPDDRFYGVTVKAESSRRVREVILRSVSPGLKAWFWDEAEKTIDALLDERTIDKIVGQFSTKGISLEQLEKSVGRPVTAGWTKEDRKNLLGLWNAIKDGETTIAEAFGDQAKPTQETTPKPTSGVVTADSLLGKPTPTESAESAPGPTSATTEPEATEGREPGSDDE